MDNKKRIAVLVSGGGTNLQALIDAQNAGELVSGSIALVVSSRAEVYALERARLNGIRTEVVVRKGMERDSFSDAVAKVIDEHGIDLIILAGFNCILSPSFISRYPNMIINVHPALIPSFCGDGFYGLAVHEAVLESGVKLTGATVHFVNEITDGGAIILQKAVRVSSEDTPEELQKRVMYQAEWELLPRAAELFCAGKIVVDGKKTKLL